MTEMMGAKRIKTEEKPSLDWEKLSASEADKLFSGKRQELIEKKYRYYFNDLSKKGSDEVIEVIRHWESINHFLGNKCRFWGEKKLPGIIKEDKKIYDWKKLKPEEKEELLIGIPEGMLFGNKNNPDSFFAKSRMGDYYKKTLESLGVLMELGDIADALIREERIKGVA